MDTNSNQARRVVIGITAHVDAGKTTLAEAMLYRTGRLRKLGRVDHGSAAMDSHLLERERGITIFSSQAELPIGDLEVTLLDTPGHVDFSTETERTLQVLDYAVLVISGTDGVQSHTETLWRLLRRYRIPTFVFVNKMDLPGPGREALLTQLNHRLGDGFVDFGAEQADRDEALALCDERLMETMLDRESLTDTDLIPAIARRHVFPCWFGSALKLQGVDALVEGLDRYTRPAPALEAFGAKVFKVSQDEQGNRLTWLRVTGGALKVKAQLTGEVDGEPWAEKANQLRLYSGAKFTLAECIGPGQVCAVTGLTKARPGEGLGAERDSDLPVLEPVLSLGQPSPWAMADGRLLWRVLDNLMSNICKYAMPGTRVYLTTEREGDTARMVVRNISRYPLNISADELTERFVRGDSSRSTEGSGLGLSIATSLMSLQGRGFRLTIDGDLFKVTLTLPAAGAEE